MYFHARFNRERSTRRGVDYTVLDGVRGKGYYVGTYIGPVRPGALLVGRGRDEVLPRRRRGVPHGHSTGAEDYFGGAWAFPRQAAPRAARGAVLQHAVRRLPVPLARDATRDRLSAGKPNPNPMLATNDDALPRHGLYRWHLPDPISFKEDLRVTFQDLGTTTSSSTSARTTSPRRLLVPSEPHAVLAPLPQGRTACPGRVASKQANVMAPAVDHDRGRPFARRIT